MGGGEARLDRLFAEQLDCLPQLSQLRVLCKHSVTMFIPYKIKLCGDTRHLRPLD